METTINIDLGMIIAALAPTIAIIVASRLASKTGRAAAGAALAAADAGKEAADASRATKAQVDAIHTLVNDQLTQEKRERLVVLKANLALLSATLRANPGSVDAKVVEFLELQAHQLEEEIQQRDKVAAVVAVAQPSTVR